MNRAFLIGEAGERREQVEELLDAAGVSIVGRSDEMEVADEELAEAEFLVWNGSAEELQELLEPLQAGRVLRGTKPVLFTEPLPEETVNRALRVGVRAVLPIEIGAEQLTAALEAVAHGLVVLHPRELTVPRTASHGAAEAISPLLEPLTLREREVLRMMSDGLGNKEIAARLKLSEHTVKFHVASILGKLGATSRTEAVSIALRRGLILV